MVPEIWSATDRIFCHWTVFCPFTPPPPPMGPENQNFEKIKKPLEDIIILKMFAINDNYMIYGFSDRSATDKTFCHFGPFCVL